MTKKLDMRYIRYMNLFGRTSRVQPKHCFSYNNVLIFVVPKQAVAKAIGKDNQNLRKLSEILGKRIRIVAEPVGKFQSDIRAFISTIVFPVEFSELEIANNEATITAGGREQRARLIGRERIRQHELAEILEQYFGIKSLKIT